MLKPGSKSGENYFSVRGILREPVEGETDFFMVSSDRNVLYVYDTQNGISNKLVQSLDLRKLFGLPKLGVPFEYEGFYFSRNNKYMICFNRILKHLCVFRYSLDRSGDFFRDHYSFKLPHDFLLVDFVLLDKQGVLQFLSDTQTFPY